MKLIDADKLIAEIKRQKRELELSIQSQGDYGQSCHIVAYEDILSLINSLQQEQPEVDLAEEITDKSRACCNCVNGIPQYPNCYCWQHKYCNTDEPYKIPKENWVETAKKCKGFEFEPELNTVLINARKEE